MISIPLPGGYRPEEGKGPGDEVQALVTLKIAADGTSADVMAVDGATYGDEPESKDDPQEEVQEQPEGASDDDASSDAFGSRLDQAMASMKM